MKLALSAAAATVLLLGACSTAPKTDLALPAPVASQPPSPAPGAATAPVASAGKPEYLDPASAMARQRTVHFGFDDSTIQPADRTVVEVQGRYLALHPNVSVRVEGNTDERGSSEYNLALGQRRAIALEKALTVYGARESQIEATSWGEEKPVAQGHDDTAWAQNRRAEVVYPAR